MPESNTPDRNRREFAGAIEINEAHPTDVPSALIRETVERVLVDAGYRQGQISIALVDNDTIHQLNRDYLQHDCPTDVLSFTLECEPERGWLEGEVIVSSEMAREVAQLLDHSPAAELLLYVVHGALHLVGHDDREESDRQRMRELEADYLSRLGYRGTWAGQQKAGNEFQNGDDSR